MKKFKLKRKILRFIASFTVFFRMNIVRDIRVSLIQYKYQKLENPFESADDEKTIVKLKEKLEAQDALIKLLINNLPLDKKWII